MPEISKRSGIVGKQRGDLRRSFQRAARRIALKYERAFELDARQKVRDSRGARRAGDKRIKRIPVPPCCRPNSVLKRELYDLACQVRRDPRKAIELEMLVRKRDRAGGIIHRPREATAVDWVIRLVTKQQFTAKNKSIRIYNVNRLSPSMLSRMAIELNYAMVCGVQPELVNMFIDAVGGYEMISAEILENAYDIKKQRWWPFVTGKLERVESIEGERFREAAEELSET